MPRTVRGNILPADEQQPRSFTDSPIRRGSSLESDFPLGYFRPGDFWSFRDSGSQDGTLEKALLQAKEAAKRVVANRSHSLYFLAVFVFPVSALARQLLCFTVRLFHSCMFQNCWFCSFLAGCNKTTRCLPACQGLGMLPPPLDI